MSRWQAGESIAGRLKIEGRLAAGGMAEVYVAELSLPRGVRRRVAVKRVHAHLAEDPHFLTLFLDEARLLGKLAHPGIVPVLDVIESDGELLLVLDYVPGWDLAALLAAARTKGETLPLAAALLIGKSIAETLAYVHSAKDLEGRPLSIVHRDVNPSNVLIAEDGSVRLLDFGVAKAAEKVAHTITRSIKGKLAYLAPEQAKAETLDHRTDLYGLGLVLFEMLSGRRALEAGTEIALLEKAKAPLHPPLASVAEVPSEIAALVDALLAIDRDRRPPSAAAVALVLERASVQAGSGREALPAWILSRMETSRREPTLARSALDRALLEVAREDGGPKTNALGQTPPLIAAPATETEPTRPKRSRAPIAIAAALIALGAGATWRALSPDEKPPAAPRSPAYFRINTTPPGASIAIDGRAEPGATPLIVEADPSAGAEIVATLDDHLPTSTRATAIAGRTLDLALVLPARPGMLSLKSAPTNAEVFLDGTSAGRTPLELTDLPRRRMRLELALPGRRRFEAPVPLDERSEVTIDAALEPELRYGLLDVSADPWAAVQIDGRKVAESTPLVGHSLEVGEHRLRLSNPRLKKIVERKVIIREGQRESVIVRLR